VKPQIQQTRPVVNSAFQNFATLNHHLQLARRAGNDQAKLEEVVRSLETNEVVRGYQHWREVATTE
jgi:cell fate (sporulation/competence/biofilm development) regulator YlbF (YheA/YmcA/DUF963 family)